MYVFQTDKALLKEQLLAKQKAQEAKIQNIKTIYAKAKEEALSSREIVAKAEVQSTQAETSAIEAVNQSEEALRRAEEVRQAEEAKRKVEVFGNAHFCCLVFFFLDFSISVDYTRTTSSK